MNIYFVNLNETSVVFIQDGIRLVNTKREALEVTDPRASGEPFDMVSCMIVVRLSSLRIVAPHVLRVDSLWNILSYPR